MKLRYLGFTKLYPKNPFLLNFALSTSHTWCDLCGGVSGKGTFTIQPKSCQLSYSAHAAAQKVEVVNDSSLMAEHSSPKL